MTDSNNKKGNILVSYRFPDDTGVTTDIDNELIIQQEISKLMHKFVSDGIISHFVIADDDVISEKLTKNPENEMEFQGGMNYEM